MGRALRRTLPPASTAPPALGSTPARDPYFPAPSSGISGQLGMKSAGGKGAPDQAYGAAGGGERERVTWDGAASPPLGAQALRKHPGWPLVREAGQDLLSPLSLRLAFPSWASQL